MKNNTARKLSQIPPGYLIMGIDPHKKVHVAVAMTQDTIIHTRFKFANSRQGYEQVMRSTSDQIVKTGSTGVIFAIETGGHYWRNLAYSLGEQGIPFRLINPEEFAELLDKVEREILDGSASLPMAVDEVIKRIA